MSAAEVVEGKELQRRIHWFPVKKRKAAELEVRAMHRHLNRASYNKRTQQVSSVDGTQRRVESNYKELSSKPGKKEQFSDDSRATTMDKEEGHDKLCRRNARKQKK